MFFIRYHELAMLHFVSRHKYISLRPLRLRVEKSLIDLLVTNLGDYVFSFALWQHQDEFIIQ